MKKHYPLHFTMDNGTKEEVNKVDEKTFEFNLSPEKGSPQRFTYLMIVFQYARPLPRGPAARAA